MKIVLQRVSRAAVRVNGETVGSIGRGLVALVGIGAGDTREHADKLAAKIEKLRIFADAEGKTNLSSADSGGEILIISQFTLLADCKKGNRPSFTNAGPPALARELVDYFANVCEGRFAKTARGLFGEDMAVELVNDGPFTVILEEL